MQVALNLSILILTQNSKRNSSTATSLLSSFPIIKPPVSWKQILFDESNTQTGLLSMLDLV